MSDMEFSFSEKDVLFDGGILKGKCIIVNDTSKGAYYFELITENGKKKYRLFWDYGDEAMSFTFNPYNPIMTILYAKRLSFPEFELDGGVERFTGYDSKKEEFFVLCLHRKSRSVWIGTPRFKWKREKFKQILKNLDCKRPFYLSPHPFYLSDYLEGLESAEKVPLILNVRNSDEIDEVQITEWNEGE